MKRIKTYKVFEAIDFSKADNLLRPGLKYKMKINDIKSKAEEDIKELKKEYFTIVDECMYDLTDDFPNQKVHDADHTIDGDTLQRSYVFSFTPNGESWDIENGVSGWTSIVNKFEECAKNSLSKLNGQRIKSSITHKYTDTNNNQTSPIIPLSQRTLESIVKLESIIKYMREGVKYKRIDITILVL